jgi:hypothetical protein
MIYNFVKRVVGYFVEYKEREHNSMGRKFG